MVAASISTADGAVIDVPVERHDGRVKIQLFHSVTSLSSVNNDYMSAEPII